jgi:very-short-patch-repair endonuclease
MTPAEAALWVRLRDLRQLGFHFRRQAPFRGYYLDFVCFKRRLVVEVDGSQHGLPEQQGYDAVRDAVLRREGYQTLRVWNGEVLREIETVLETIWRALQVPPPVPHPSRLRRSTLPTEGEGDV